ncbi:MAG: HEPN domain-containing protein [Smithellaceae bacterium]|nr:HEPN domain-containing protein [Smithellaceae bacterium]
MPCTDCSRRWRAFKKPNISSLAGKAYAPWSIAFITYGMFYAVLALLIHEPYASSKHSGVLAYFNKRFVKGGLFSASLGRTLNRAFELRQRGDYREYFEVTKDQVDPLLDEAAQFIAAVRTYLEESVEFGR